MSDLRKVALHILNTWDAEDWFDADVLRAALVVPGPVCDKDPRGCWSVRCQLGKVCKNAPPCRKPLTEEEIEYIAPVSFTWRDMVTFARNVECEHGIV